MTLANLARDLRKSEKGWASLTSIFSLFLYSFSSTDDDAADVADAADVDEVAEVDEGGGVRQLSVGIDRDQVHSPSAQTHSRVAFIELSDRHTFVQVIPCSYVELVHNHPSGTVAHSCFCAVGVASPAVVDAAVVDAAVVVGGARCSKHSSSCVSHLQAVSS